MVKLELVKAISQKTGVAQKNVMPVINALGSVITETLKYDKDERITIPKLGTFTATQVNAKDGIDRLHGGIPWHKDAYSKLTFRASERVKEL